MKKIYYPLLSLFLLFGLTNCTIDNSNVSKKGNSITANFKGKIAKTYEESVEDWPKEKTFTGEEPNVLIIMLDDTGFGQLESFGGIVSTPNMNKIASNGLRYNNFHTTSLCSPSRAAILAGRNHHSIGLGSHALTAMGFPGYAGRVPLEAMEVARLARDEGYTTYALGKWDHTPGYHVHQQGPFTYWPSNDGFDHNYTFMSADANNFDPVMYLGHEPVDAKEDNEDYHLTEDIADKAINYLTGHKSINPDRPFFMFWAPGAMHAPHHAPQNYIEKYKGKFDMGWDELRKIVFERQKKMGIIPENTLLTERADDLPAWDSLTDRQKKMYAKQMEAFAGMLDHTDAQIGRIMETIERMDELDNTIVIVTSDNGASGEGGTEGSHNELNFINGISTTPFEENEKKEDEWGTIETNNHYHAGWAWAGNTPFKYFKQMSHRGGQADPLIISWPKGIKDKGAIRQQYCHIIDITPTIMEATNVEFREEIDGIEQIPMDGTSLAYTFNNPTAKDRHTVQYYELLGNRAIYKDGWKAVTIHGNRMPWDGAGRYDFNKDVWELYHVSEDFSEAKDLAKVHPEKLEELKKVFDEEAVKYNVFPLYDDLFARLKNTNLQYAPHREEYIYYPPGAVRIAEGYSPPVKNKKHSITSYIKNYKGEEGVLLAAGGIYGGYTVYIKDNKLVYNYNAYNNKYFTISSNILPKGQDLELEVVYTPILPKDKRKIREAKAKIELFVNGQSIGKGFVNQVMPGTYSLSETFDVGTDEATSVAKEWRNKDPKFKGDLQKVKVKLL